MSTKLKLGIILGSTREGRVSPQVGQWVKSIADARSDVEVEIVDIKDYKLPLLGESDDLSGVMAWNAKLAELDGFVFIVSEYNRSMSAALKNAFDSAREAWNNKAAGIVSYGSAGGARAAEHVRTVLGELQVADVRSHTLLSLFTDFDNGIFKPADLHKVNVNTMFDQLKAWGSSLKAVRATQ